MKLEQYEKYISAGNCYQYLLVASPKFHEYMQKHGILCSHCKKPFIPQPFYSEGFAGVTHYPTESVCGFCVYDMDGDEHSRLLEDELWEDSA